MNIIISILIFILRIVVGGPFMIMMTIFVGGLLLAVDTKATAKREMTELWSDYIKGFKQP
jgi:hypothetical protein